LFVGNEDDVSAPSAVTTIRTTESYELLSAKAYRTTPSIAGPNGNLYFVNESN
jgi:hypothetical protein